ncbi:MAG: AmmeMemoRadiSam system protein A [Thermoanaerobaculia bacterium]
MPGTESTRRGAILLRLARASLDDELRGAASTGPADEARHYEPWLLEPGATFVTLRRGDELRGCVGSVEIVRPLIEDVRRNAVAAALRDPRFPPLELVELVEVELEVTLLSSPEPISFTSETDALAQLRPGEDGLLLQWQRHRATYLPQVWESLRDPEAFLASLKRKAGLAPDFWHPELDLRRYTAEHWSESELPG